MLGQGCAACITSSLTPPKQGLPCPAQKPCLWSSCGVCICWSTGCQQQQAEDVAAVLSTHASTKLLCLGTMTDSPCLQQEVTRSALEAASHTACC